MRCDVDFEQREVRYVGEPLDNFPRVAAGPNDRWVAVGDPDGLVQIRLWTGAIHNVGRRHPNNGVAVRWNGVTFHVFWVGWHPGSEMYGVWRVTIAQDGTVFAPIHVDSGAGSGSQGFRDIDADGIHWQDAERTRWVHGVLLFNWKQRGPYIIGSPAAGLLGVALFDESTERWYAPYHGDVQLNAGLAPSGTVAVSAVPGGFVPKSEWLTRPWNPHAVVEPDPTAIAYARPTWCGPWHASTEEYGYHEFPGNMEVLTQYPLRPTDLTKRRRDVPALAAAAIAARLPTDKVIGVLHYVGPDGVVDSSELDYCRTVATVKRAILWHYVDQTSGVNLGFARRGEGFLAQAYVRQQESADQARLRIHVNLRAAQTAGLRLGLVRQLYDGSGTFALQDVLDWQAHVSALAQAFNVSLDTWFALAPVARGGLLAHAELWRVGVNLAASAGSPVKEEIVEQQYGVSIVSYDRDVRPNQAAVAIATVLGNPAGLTLRWRWRAAGSGMPWSIAAVNPATDLDHAFRFHTAGRYEIGVDLLANGNVVDATAAQRIVGVSGEPVADTDLRAQLRDAIDALDEARTELDAAAQLLRAALGSLA